MKTIHILIGPPGSGKSTFAKGLADKDTLVVNLDSISTMLHAGEYGGYDREIANVYYEIETHAIRQSLKAGKNVIVDRTNIDKKTRIRYIAFGAMYDAKVVAHVMPILSEGELLFRRRMGEDGRGLGKEVWEEVIQSMLKRYEEPEKSEGFDKIIFEKETSP